MRRLAVFVAALGVLTVVAAPAAQPSAVSVFPIPGDRVASPQTQIAFRGLSPSALSNISVVGSRTGVHTGAIAADSDGRGASFLPSTRFVAGETVTVTTSLNVLGASNGRFSFTIATSSSPIPYLAAQTVGRTAGDVWRYRSRGDLAPAAVKLLRSSSHAAAGDWFVAPQFGPVENGPEILDSSGNLVWFYRVPHGDAASDFRVQQYRGRPALTWWEGYTDAGIGVGQDLIYDSAYNPVASVRAANGLSADLHEFQLTPQGTALITAYYPVYWDASSIRGGLKREITLDSVVQEIDIPTGLVLFQWDSLDHVPVTDTYEPLPHQTATIHNPFDYFHANSVQLDDDGTLIVSGRNTWAAYKVNHQSGAVVWALGGRHSSFSMGTGTGFAFQHDVRVRAQNDQYVTVFDDGAGPPNIHGQSRALKLRLDLKRKTATGVWQHEHSPPLLSQFEGNYQQLPDADDLVGWGQQPFFTEYDPHGQLIVDGRFVGTTSSYRVYKFPWQGQPQKPPDAAASTSGKTTTVYASWNGATTVSGWRVLSGPSATVLRPTRAVPRRGFETSTQINAARYVAVQALDSRGRVLARSSPVRAG
ncbi:MAG TPA: arylsulfotransferase family protein [Solirubrobacteraceae bacterium]